MSLDNSTTMLVSSSSQFSQKLQPPMLVLPVHDNYSRKYFLYNPADSRISGTIASKWGSDYQSCRCVGSSKGWMILHHSTENSESCLSLFSPLSTTDSRRPRKIVLPPYNRPSGFEIRWIMKSILTIKPVQPGYKFGVVFLYGVCYNKIALLMMHDDQDDKNQWIDLKSSREPYADVVSNQDFLFAMLTCGSVDVWDLRSISDGGSIDKKMKIETSYIDLGHMVEYGDTFRDLYTTKFYLVESQGNLFLALRIIGEFVREDGEVVNEGALLDDEFYSHLVLPYKTKNFYVFKLDSGLKKWVKVDSLGDQILFVGLNQSMLFSALDIQECQENSIYFSDDNWDHINIHENDMYGGHDMGIFSLNDKSVKEIFEMKRRVPPPVWVDLDMSDI